MINVDGINEMVNGSPDYKVVIKGGSVYVVPVTALGGLDFAKNSVNQDHAAVLIVTASGQVIKSRWTNPTMNDGPRCDCDEGSDDYR